MQRKRSTEELIIRCIYLEFGRNQHLQAATAVVKVWRKLHLMPSINNLYPLIINLST
ncbi:MULTISPECIES: hypothetical protein [unclassified Nostoc]|uniref:hypothetical protein n=1 Tax=unclassified Nostoc TaxID=2593658 RepID=UPI0013D41FC1|nr:MULTISPECIES: hypothetical protein [unclassified Nostoc]MBE8998657.1 hypothetical protein [Nostoc sp. LEGE 12447]NEU79769.1 hypothetical protein [Nostoc sp. UIC 10630]